MARRGPRSGNAVSLFPFLAVLICAMGALILLLLITTRRIRQQQAERAAAGETIRVVEREPLITEPAPAPPQKEPARNSEYLDEPLDPLFALAPAPELADPNDEWRTRLKRLQSEHTQLAAALASRTSRVGEIRAALSVDSRELERLQHESTAIEEATNQLDEQFERLEQDHRAIDDRMAFLRRQIDVAREQAARASAKYSIVPYDGRLGTARRPIVIECREDAISFVSEGVTITPSQLDGFTPESNPLAAASRALSKYWERKDREDGDALAVGPPYVLLIVRPQGTVSYYVTRKLLGAKLDAFGYELVRDDQEFVWPETDEMATRICRTIVERMISDKQLLMAAMPDRLQDPFTDYSDEIGLFRMEEVDRSRNRDEVRSVTINGHRYFRESDRIVSDGGSPFTRPGSSGTTGQNGGNSIGIERTPFPIVGQDDDGIGDSGAEAGQDIAAAERNGGAGGGGSREAGAGPTRLQTINPDRTGEPVPTLTLTPTDVPRLSAPPAASFSEFVRQSRAARKESGSAGELAAISPPAGQQQSKAADSDALDWTNAGHGAGDEYPMTAPRPADVPPGVDGESPRWGIRGTGGTIGFEQDIVVRVTATDVVIADETTFPITLGMSTEEMRLQFARHLNHQVNSWGEPPRSFYWLPSVKFVISPGGNQFYERLKAVTARWQVRSTVEYVLN